METSSPFWETSTFSSGRACLALDSSRARISFRATTVTTPGSPTVTVTVPLTFSRLNFPPAARGMVFSTSSVAEAPRIAFPQPVRRTRAARAVMGIQALRSMAHLLTNATYYGG